MRSKSSGRLGASVPRRISAMLVVASAALCISAAADRPLNAQQVDSSCVRGQPTYDRCVLSLDRGRLYLGTPPIEIGRLSIFHAPHVSDVVHGDSSLHYAKAFEDASRRARSEFLVAMLAVGIASGVAVGNTYRVPRIAGRPFTILMVTSGTVTVASYVISGRHYDDAFRSLLASIAWNNSALRR